MSKEKMHKVITKVVSNSRLSSILYALMLGFQSTMVVAEIMVTVNPVPGRDGQVCVDTETHLEVTCNDTYLFEKEGWTPVMYAFNFSHYDRLEDLYSQWCSGRDRFPDGTWKLSRFGDSLYRNFSGLDMWPKVFKQIKEWQQSNKDSTAALYAEAIYWRAYAWKARGGGYAKDVPKEGWELFHERLNKAKDILSEIKEYETGCPAFYPLTISVLTELGSSEKELQEVYSEGVGLYPEYHNIYFSMAKHYQPRWGGSLAEYEHFAINAAEKTRGFEGMGMYARLFWLVDNRNGYPFYAQSQDPPDWKMLRMGYDDLMQKYPLSIHNLIQYTNVACRSEDSELYRKLRSRIDGYSIGSRWVDSVDACDLRHKWAKENM